MTFPRLVLGIDAGPRESGFAILDFSISTAPLWLDGGTVANVSELFESSAYAPLETADTLVCVEQPRALHNPLANAKVMETCFAAGDAHGFARAYGFQVLAVGVNEWRLTVVGVSRRGDVGDRKVERVLRSYVRGMPTRTNVHSRDAAGVAWAGLLKFRHHPPDINVRAKPLSRKTVHARSRDPVTPVRLTDAQRATLAAARARTLDALTPEHTPDRSSQPNVAGANPHAHEYQDRPAPSRDPSAH